MIINTSFAAVFNNVLDFQEVNVYNVEKVNDIVDIFLSSYLFFPSSNNNMAAVLLMWQIKRARYL